MVIQSNIIMRLPNMHIDPHTHAMQLSWLPLRGCGSKHRLKNVWDTHGTVPVMFHAMRSCHGASGN